MGELYEILGHYLRLYGNNVTETGVNCDNIPGTVDRILIKTLAQTNTLNSQDKTGHQTHIAITGDEMDIFDTSEDSPNVVDLRHNGRFVKDFVVRNNIMLLSDNFRALGGRVNTQSSVIYT